MGGYYRPKNKMKEMFKIETNDGKNQLDNVMVYGISAKRYCMYKIANGKIKIL